MQRLGFFESSSPNRTTAIRRIAAHHDRTLPRTRPPPPSRHLTPVVVAAATRRCTVRTNPSPTDASADEPVACVTRVRLHPGGHDVRWRGNNRCCSWKTRRRRARHTRTRCSTYGVILLAAGSPATSVPPLSSPSHTPSSLFSRFSCRSSYAAAGPPVLSTGRRTTDNSVHRSSPLCEKHVCSHAPQRFLDARRPFG